MPKATTITPAPPPQPAPQAQPKGMWKLVVGCTGVVYGDIGTSPLYALRESLHALGGKGDLRQEVVGVVSLLIWTLMLIVTIKYVLLVMRADNRGEGARYRWSPSFSRHCKSGRPGC